MPYSILIVDDSTTTRMMIKRTIQLAGIPVGRFLEADDGQAALAQLERGGVDLVLADLNMPNMGGLEMTRHMRSSEPTRSIPVVFVSADPNFDTPEKLKSDGAQGYVRKPFTPEMIRNVVQNLLEVSHA